MVLLFVRFCLRHISFEHASELKKVIQAVQWVFFTLSLSAIRSRSGVLNHLKSGESAYDINNTTFPFREINFRIYFIILLHRYFCRITQTGNFQPDMIPSRAFKKTECCWHICAKRFFFCFGNCPKNDNYSVCFGFSWPKHTNQNNSKVINGRYLLTLPIKF